jgi:hypothetical protein
LAANRPDLNCRLVGERMIAAAHYHRGDFSSARRHLERVLAEHATPDYASLFLRFQFRPHVVARILLAWTLWLEGFPDQAIRAAESSVEEARAANHVLIDTTRHATEATGKFESFASKPFAADFG